MRLPVAPLNSSNAELHKSLKSLLQSFHELNSQGTRHPAFTQAQIDARTSLKDAGTTVFNQTTGENNTSYIDSGAVKWRGI